MGRMIACLLLVLCPVFLGGCDLFVPETTLDLSFSTLSRSSPRERMHSLFEIRQAWDFRPDRTDGAGRRAELRFVNRCGLFVRRLQGTESVRDGAQLWRRIYLEHEQRFPSGW